MPKTLSSFIGAAKILERRGSADPAVTGLAYDSRKVEPGFLFFALPGLHVDGARFVPMAVAKGAVAVVHEGELPSYDDGVAYLRVQSARLAMSPVAAAFHDDPSGSLAVIGVTGTEGKSTTVSLVFQLLRLAGKRAGFISTVEYCAGDGVIANPEHQTTPEAVTIHQRLAEMRDNGCEFAVIESSSHGLSEKTGRLADVRFDAGIMTNVTHEHLEFHGTHERYKSDKANLFRALDLHAHVKAGKSVPSFGVVNDDDPAAEYFRQATKKPVYRYSTSCSADFPGTWYACGVTADAAGADFSIREAQGPKTPARINLPGAFNVKNALAALIAVAKILGRPVGELAPLLPRLTPVRGRMTVIDEGQDFEVLVDYAHTPSSFREIFPPLRSRVKGRVISLFGSGGERDTLKRPEQGRIAADYSDVVILADEDPRGEDPMTLLEEIAAGCPEKKKGEGLFLIPDRPAAIRKAFSLAKKGDLVLLLGKGHENSIIYRDHTVPYDEIAEAHAALKELKP